MKIFFIYFILILSIANSYPQKYDLRKLKPKQQDEWNKYLIRVEESRKLKIIKDSISKHSIYKNTNSPILQCEEPIIPPKFTNCINEVNLNNLDCFTREVQWHIKRYFSYPSFALDYGIEGKVFITFEINEEGIIEIKDVNGPNNGLILEEEVTRFMNKLPKVTPAYQCDLPFRFRYSTYISFKIG